MIQKNTFAIIILVIASLYVNPTEATNCSLKSPHVDAAKRFGENEKREFIVQEEALSSSSKKDLIFIDKLSCNSSGCSLIIYAPEGPKDCYAFAGQFFGFLSVDRSQKIKRPNLKEGQRTRPLEFNSKTKMYEVRG